MKALLKSFKSPEASVKILLSLLLMCVFTARANDLEHTYSLKEQYHRLEGFLNSKSSVRAFYAHLDYEKTSELASFGPKDQRASAAAKLAALKDYKDYNLASFYDLPSIDEGSFKVSNLYEILSGLSQKRALKKELKEYSLIVEQVNDLAIKAEQAQQIAAKLYELKELDISYLKQAQALAQTLKQGALIISNSEQIFKDRASTLSKQLDTQIASQYRSAFVFVIVFVAILGSRLLLARIIAAAVSDKDKLYSITKVLNIFTTFIVIMFSIFYFVENISYLISVLGFASAGLAIAMKDMFMSLLGWCVLQFGGGFRVGDRIRVCKDGEVYVGDIVDIGPLKMVIYEDVTLTTYTTNRRAGRLVYVPNNYVFTDLLANYNYSALKFVWDGVDVAISFDSDIEAAKNAVLNAANSQCAAYASTAKMAISKMRNHYSMRSSGTEARIFSILEPYGIKISVWYMAPSRETLRTKSLVSAAVIKAILATPGVKIAYPTQTLYKKDI